MKSKYLCIECQQPLDNPTHPCPGRCQGQRIHRAQWEQSNYNYAQALCDILNDRRAITVQEAGK